MKQNIKVWGMDWITNPNEINAFHGFVTTKAWYNKLFLILVTWEYWQNFIAVFYSLISNYNIHNS
jgi:hypothetical protein